MSKTPQSVPDLIAKLGEGTEDDVLKVCTTLFKLSSSEEKRAQLGPHSMLLVPALMKWVGLGAPALQSKTCSALKNLSFIPENKILMCSRELGLVAVLVNVLEKVHSHSLNLDDKTVVTILDILSNIFFSESSYQLSLQSDVDRKLVQCIVQELRWQIVNHSQLSSDGATRTARACRVIEILTAARGNETILAMSEFGLLSTLFSVVQNADMKAKVRAAIALWNISEFSSEMVAMELMGIKEGNTVMLSILRTAGPDPSCWAALEPKAPIATSTSESLPLVVLRFFMNLARHSFAAVVLRQQGLLDIAVPLLTCLDHHASLQALFIVTFLTGRDEDSGRSGSALCETAGAAAAGGGGCITAQSIALLVQVFTNTLNGEDGDGYRRGTFCLQVLVSAILSLSISDANKYILVGCETILPLLLRTLDLFINNAPDIPLCGGGGSDVATACITVEALLQLSFHFEDDLALQQQYMPAPLDIASRLHAFIAIADGSVRPLPSPIDPAAKRNAMNLLKRLVALPPARSVPGTAIAGLTHPSPACSPKHIMISYAWGANRELVVKLAEAIRAQGFDVWRDEDGSAVLPKMAGHCDERMAEAIEASHTLLVCVSRAYKESANCRSEAHYGSQLFKQGILSRVVFLMLEEEYTPLSRPAWVNGWLGFMIGENLWYPLWAESLVAAAATSVVGLIREQGPVRGSHGVANQSSALNLISVHQTPASLTPHVTAVPSLPEPPSVPVVSPAPCQPQAHTTGPSSSALQSLAPIPPRSTAHTSRKPPTSFLTCGSPVVSSQAPHDIALSPPPVALQPLPPDASTAPQHRQLTPQSLGPASTIVSERLMLGPQLQPQPQPQLHPLGSESSSAHSIDPQLRPPTVQHVSPTPSLNDSPAWATMWGLLHDDVRVAHLPALRAELLGLGVAGSTELAVCDSSALRRIAAHLRPAPQTLFLLLWRQIACEGALALLVDPTRAVDPHKLRACTQHLGLATAADLAACTPADLQHLAALLKPIPKKLFVALLWDEMN